MLFFVLDHHNHTCNKEQHVFNQFQIYDNIAEKGCAGGLKVIPT